MTVGAGKWFEFLPRNAIQSAVMPQYVGCLSVRPSVCLSVTFMYRDHVGFNTSKITSRLNMKSHTRFRLVPKSLTFDDLEPLKRSVRL